MQRFYQTSFVVVLMALSWFGMLAFHELGHVVGAVATGGKIERVVLHPLTISRTDVSPNPNPSVVVWLGPIIGCVLPLICWLLVPQRMKLARNMAKFFAGFCLIANGGYIAMGSIDRVGDCGEMLRNGSPMWTLSAFGGVTIPLGLYVWHRLGSVKQFVSLTSEYNASVDFSRTAWLLLLILLAIVAVEFAFSSM